MKAAVAVALALLFCAPLEAQPVRSRPRGYLPRPCGFDMDGDGLVGESLDDCNVCDGSTTDVDGDGVDEDLTYVDAAAGADRPSCGRPAAPCRSIGFALRAVDGPGDGAEDILCLHGTFREDSLVINASGLATTRTRARSGNEDRAFEYPSNPLMIVGWDFDDDGQYPPTDGDDLAVLDGTGARHAITNHGAYVEAAHFEARNYGQFDLGAAGLGFWRGGQQSHVYIHDLRLNGIGRGACVRSDAQVFSGFSSHRWFAVENLRCLECGGTYFFRGSGNVGGSFGPLRFKNISYTARGADRGQCEDSRGSATAYISDLWAHISGIEFIDNVFDANLGAWTPDAGPGRLVGLQVTNCTRDWHVVNNDWIDWTAVSGVGGGDDFCNRTTSDIRYEGNLYYHNNPSQSGKFGGVRDQATNGASRSENVRVINNVAVAGPLSAGIRVFWENRAENREPGAGYRGGLTLANNTFYTGGKGGTFFSLSSSGAPNHMEEFLLVNNVVDGADVNIELDRVPAALRSDFNVFDAGGRYRSPGGAADSLTGWTSRTGFDASSRECTPLFVDADAGNVHLLAADNCAVDAGTELSTVTRVDADGVARVVPWEAGAYELGSGPGEPPPGDGPVPPPPPPPGDCPECDLPDCVAFPDLPECRGTIPPRDGPPAFGPGGRGDNGERWGQRRQERRRLRPERKSDSRSP